MSVGTPFSHVKWFRRRGHGQPAGVHLSRRVVPPQAPPISPEPGKARRFRAPGCSRPCLRPCPPASTRVDQTEVYAIPRGARAALAPSCAATCALLRRSVGNTHETAKVAAGARLWIAPHAPVPRSSRIADYPPPAAPRNSADVPFTARSAQRAGVSAGRLRASDLARPFRGVRAPPPHSRTNCRGDAAPTNSRCIPNTYSATRPQRSCTACRCPCTPYTCWTRSTSAHQHRCARLERESPDIRSRMPSGRGEFIHYGPLGMDVRVQVASPELVWAQLAPRSLVDDLVAVGDADRRRPAPLGTIADLHRIAGDYAGHRGSVTIATSIGHVRVGSLAPGDAAAPHPRAGGIPEPA